MAQFHKFDGRNTHECFYTQPYKTTSKYKVLLNGPEMDLLYIIRAAIMSLPVVLLREPPAGQVHSTRLTLVTQTFQDGGFPTAAAVVRW